MDSKVLYNVVFTDRLVAYSSNLFSMARITFSPIVSVAADESTSLGFFGGSDLELPPYSVVYDLLGSQVAANHSEMASAWRATAPGLYVVVNSRPSTAKIRWYLVE